MIILWIVLAGPSAEAVDAALQRVLASGEYQAELPGHTAPEVERRPEPLAKPPDDPPAPLASGDGLRPVGAALWWFLVAVLFAAVAGWLVREWAARRSAEAARAPLEEEAPAGPVRRDARALPDHGALARQGLYADAIHAVLLLVLAGVGRLAPAWTSREIVRRVELGGAARSALAGLVELVERSRFAGAVVGEAEYRRAVAWLGVFRGGAA